MPWARLDVLNALQGAIATLAGQLGQATTDTAAGWGPAIDQALLEIGIAPGSLAGPTIPDQQIPLVRAIVRLRALEQLADLAAVTYVDTSVGVNELNVKWSQVNTNLDRLIARALAEVQQRQQSIGAPAVGQLTQTSPVMTPAHKDPLPPPLPDPNDRQYRGDPLRRRFTTRTPW